MINVKDKLRKLAKIAFTKKRLLKEHKLVKEASSRDYYRLYLSSDFSCIAMILNDFENDPQIANRIIDSTDVFKALGITVPEIYHFFEDEKIFLVQDAGHSSLENHLRKFGKKKYILKYMKILDRLLEMHNLSYPIDIKSKIPLITKFNEAKFNDEFAFFLKYSGLNESLDSLKMKMIQDLFSWVSKEICREKFVLTHRDLHSRNIFIDDDKITFIDHQDARLGPYQYDLVSLLRDSYVDLPNEVRTELIAYYLDSSQRVWKNTIDEKSFFRGYYLCMFQRSIKACGTFFNQYRIKKNLKYKKYIPIVISYAIIAGTKLQYDKDCIRLFEDELVKLEKEILI